MKSEFNSAYYHLILYRLQEHIGKLNLTARIIA